VSEADINRLAAGFSQTWHRPPAPDELAAQVQDHIREEVLYRTALALGLDKEQEILKAGWLGRRPGRTHLNDDSVAGKEGLVLCHLRSGSALGEPYPPDGRSIAIRCPSSARVQPTCPYSMKAPPACTVVGWPIR
jgi:hypothetical protein